MFQIPCSTKLKAFIFALLKFIIGVTVLGLLVGRAFFPQSTEEFIIEPSKKIPVFGQVLGATWDTSGEIGPAFTKKTVQLADEVETADFGLDDTVVRMAQTENPQEEINKIIEEKIDQTVEGSKDIPQEVMDTIKEEIRKEMYKQVCSEWLGKEEDKNSN